MTLGNDIYLKVTRISLGGTSFQYLASKASDVPNDTVDLRKLLWESNDVGE